MEQLAMVQGQSEMNGQSEMVQGEQMDNKEAFKLIAETAAERAEAAPVEQEAEPEAPAEVQEAPKRGRRKKEQKEGADIPALMAAMDSVRQMGSELAESINRQNATVAALESRIAAMEGKHSTSREEAARERLDALKRTADIYERHGEAIVRLVEGTERMEAALKYCADAIGFGVDKVLSKNGITGADLDAGPVVAVENSQPTNSQLNNPSTQNSKLNNSQLNNSQLTNPSTQNSQLTNSQLNNSQLNNPPTHSEPNVEDIRAAMNKYYRAHGKEAALSLIKKYATSCNVADVKPEDYAQLLMETEIEEAA